MATPSAADLVFPPLQTQTYGSQLFWLAITFGLLYWLMSRLVVPRLDAILVDRAGRIAGDLDAAAKAKAEAEEAARLYEKALADARADAQALAQKARDELNAKADANRKALEADLDKKLARAEAQIARKKASAMANVRAIAEEATVAILEQVSGKPAASGRVAAALDAVLPSETA